MRDADYTFNVPEDIFVGVVTNAPEDRYHLSVENCYFTQSAESTATVAHEIMRDGCVTEEVLRKVILKVMKHNLYCINHAIISKNLS